MEVFDFKPPILELSLIDTEGGTSAAATIITQGTIIRC
jgi:hypothetical protein